VPASLGFKTSRPSTARDWVEFGIRHYTIDNPRARVPAQGRNDTKRERAQKLEAFYNTWLDILPIQLKMAIKKLLIRGELFLKLWIDDYYYGLNPQSKQEHEDIEDRALTHFPLKLYLPDPINVFCSPAHNGLIPLDVIEYYKMTVAEAQNLCELNGWKWKDKKERKSTDTVNWTSYYDDQWRCFLIDDDPILTPAVQPNILRFCPYVHIPAGFGNENYEGKPEYLYRSILYPKRDMIKLFTRALSQADAITERYAWPRPKLHGTTEEDVKRLYGDGFSMNPDQPIIETDDVLVTFEQGEVVPPQIYQNLAMLQEQAEPNPTLAGQNPSGVYSGTHFQAEVGQAKPLYKDALKNMEDGLGIFLGLGARVIEKVINHPISVRNTDARNHAQDIQSLKPEDINGYYYVKVGMFAELPETTDLRKSIGMNAHKSNILSLNTVLKYYFDMSDDEAENEQAEMIKEEFLRNPVVQEAVVRFIAERWGMEGVTQIMDEMGMETQRGGSRRLPETMPTGIESIPARGRVGASETMPGKTELGMGAMPTRV